MTGILTPALALRYLGQLSTDLRAAVVLDPVGALLAGEEALTPPAARFQELLRPGARELVVPLGEPAARSATVLAARAADDAPTLVLLVGPLALLPLLRHDLATAAHRLVSDAPTPPEARASRSVQPLEGEEIAAQAAISAGMALLRAADELTPAIKH
ncbi:MAG TPA: hypothetical protein VGM91_11065 [Conexibacter sp.]|jgi:hypothetical protein